MTQFSEETQRLLKDLFKECENETTDGLLMELSKQDNENDAFNHLKNQGYDITYDEFKDYYEDLEQKVRDSITLLHDLSVEGDVSELSESILEHVTGGVNIKAGVVAEFYWEHYIPGGLDALANKQFEENQNPTPTATGSDFHISGSLVSVAPEGTTFPQTPAQPAMGINRNEK
jgi:hypothetical protein